MLRPYPIKSIVYVLTLRWRRQACLYYSPVGAILRIGTDLLLISLFVATQSILTVGSPILIVLRLIG